VIVVTAFLVVMAIPLGILIIENIGFHESPSGMTPTIVLDAMPQSTGHQIEASVLQISRPDITRSFCSIRLFAPNGTQYEFGLGGATWSSNIAVVENPALGADIVYTRMDSSGNIAAGDTIAVVSETGLSIGTWSLNVIYAPTGNSMCVVEIEVV